MPTEPLADVRFEVGHVLFIDIVGYSKLLINEQSEQIQVLKQIVRGTEQFRSAEAEGKLLRLPTGDGGALVFRTSAEAPVLCAFEVSKALKNHPEVKVRMGIHSGPVNEITDLNQQANIAGAGINLAQRVMDCGDAGHILVSKHVADDLEHYPRWQPYLHSLGECEVKHGVRIGVVNLYTDNVGNPKTPTKLQVAQQRRVRKRWAAIMTALVLLSAIIAAFVILSKKSTTSTPGISEKSVAVLHLENLSEEKDNAFFADGMQDELLSNLAKIKDLKVISRTSVMQYKTGITRNLKEIARQLGVSNVVEGSIRRSGSHLRVSMQLIDALSDRHVWSQNYDRTVADSVALQGELAIEIASAIGATLSPQEKARVEVTPTKNTAAYDAYLRGRALAGKIRGRALGVSLDADFSNEVNAVQSFQEAVKLDPGFVLAWAHLSWMNSNLYWIGMDRTQSRLAAAKDALDHAVTLDPNLPETHLALGYYQYYGLRDFKGALAEFQSAEKSLPNNVEVLEAIGLIQRRMGHWDEALAMMRRAFELDPGNIQAAYMLGNELIFARRFSHALAVADHILAVEPSDTQALKLKAESFWGLGNLGAVDSVVATPGAPLGLRARQALYKRNYSEASNLFSEALKKAQGYEKIEILVELGFAQQWAGNVAAAKATYQQLLQEITATQSKEALDSRAAANWHTDLSIAYAGLGDAARAVSEGQKAMAMYPTSEDSLEGPLQEEVMANIYAMLGDADNAIPILKRWIATPSSTEITPGFLRLDPIWDPIRNDSRFQELMADKK